MNRASWFRPNPSELGTYSKVSRLIGARLFLPLMCKASLAPREQMGNALTPVKVAPSGHVRPKSVSRMSTILNTPPALVTPNEL